MLDLCTNSKFTQKSLTHWAYFLYTHIEEGKPAFNKSDLCALCTSYF